MKRYYLDKIGVTDRWDQWHYEGKKKEKLKKEREKYGFDSRECYSLRDTFFEWLYERLKMYLRDADKIVDLESERAHHYDYKGESRPVKWMILEAIRLLETYLAPADRVNFFEHEQELFDNALEASRIFVQILPSMWW